MFFLADCGRAYGFEQEPAICVVVSGQQAPSAPCMDRGSGHMEASREFLGENKAPSTQALKGRLELVRKSHADHLSFGEGLIFPITVTERIEAVGSLLRRARLEKLVELRDHLGLELTYLGPSLWSFDGQ